jgi:metallo-beta-lactamase family protein
MVRMMGDEVVVHADIDKMNSFSAHADANELVKWAQGFAVPPKNIFIMHGEGKAQEALQTNLRALGYTTSIPKL